jgi:hypothetical protein
VVSFTLQPEGWVGPSAGLRKVKKRKIFYPYSKENTDDPFLQPVE